MDLLSHGQCRNVPCTIESTLAIAAVAERHTRGLENRSIVTSSEYSLRTEAYVFTYIDNMWLTQDLSDADRLSGAGLLDQE